MTTLHLGDERDTLKMLRETLCLAQTALLNDGMEASRGGGDQAILSQYEVAAERVGRIIEEIDRQRPLGADGTSIESPAATGPMTPAEHYVEAERLLAHAQAEAAKMGEYVVRFDQPAEVEQLRINLFLHDQTLAAAQVHATLAIELGAL